MSSLAHLKKQGNTISQLQKRMSELKEKKSTKDEYWKLTTDSSGTGTAIIRFLPSADVDSLPFVEMRQFNMSVMHKDINKKKYYLYRSLENIGQKDPAQEEYWANINLGTKESKEYAKRFRARLFRIVYIYVVQDKLAPQNEGKVMRMQVSQSIWDLIESKLTPQFADKDPINVFDLWEGCDLYIRACKDSKNMTTYANSEWGSVKPLLEDDEKLEEIYSQVKPLNDEIDPSNFNYKMNYDERLVKLREVNDRKLLIDSIENQSTKRKEDMNQAFDDIVKNQGDSTSTPKDEPKLDSNTDVEFEDEELKRMLEED